MATGLSSLAIAGVVVVVVVGGGGAVVAANDKCWEKNIQQLCF